MNSVLFLATTNLILGGLVFLLGFLILKENPRYKLNLVVAGMLFFGGTGAVLGALGLLAAGGTGAGHASNAASLQRLGTIWEFFFPSLLLFALVFPKEHPILRRHQSLPFLIFVPHAFHGVLVLGMAFMGQDVVHPLNVGSPDAWWRFLPSLFNVTITLFLNIHRTLFSFVNLAYGVTSAVFLWTSYRQGGAVRLRKQLSVVGFGLVWCLIFYSAATSIPTLLNKVIPGGIQVTLTTAALLFGSGGIAYAIVRHKFLDTKLIARKAILYALASSVLVGFYLVVIRQLNQFFTSLTGMDATVFEPVLLILALIVFQPAVGRLELELETLFMRDPTDYRNVLRNLGREITTTIDLDELLSKFISTVQEALLSRQVTLIVFSREHPLVFVGSGKEPAVQDVIGLQELMEQLPPGRENFRLSLAEGVITLSERKLLAETLDAELLFPLRAKGELLGALVIGPKVTKTDYSYEELVLLTSLSGQLAISVQNGLLLRNRVAVARYEEELNLARKIQRTILPDTFPSIKRLDGHALTIPSKEVGGDLYDVVPIRGGCLFAIADVSGKGVPAALLSSMIQASIRTQAPYHEDSLVGMTANINNLVYKSTTPEQFATFFVAQLFDDDMVLRFVNAGHNYPMVIRPDGSVAELKDGGLILGIVEDVAYTDGQVQLAPGDRVVLYTDGIVEANNKEGEEFGEARLQHIVNALPQTASACDITEGLLAGLEHFLDGESPQDDVTLMVLKILEPQEAEGNDSEKTNTRLVSVTDGRETTGVK